MRNRWPNSADHDRASHLMSSFWRSRRPIASVFRNQVCLMYACCHVSRAESTAPDRLLLVFPSGQGIMRFMDSTCWFGWLHLRASNEPQTGWVKR